MQDLECSSVFMIGVHELDIPLFSALKLFLSNYLDKSKTNEFRFIHITKNKAYEAKVAGFTDIVSRFYILLKHSKLK